MIHSFLTSCRRLFSILRFSYQEHSNVGAVSLLFFQDTTRRLLREMDARGLETEEERVKHEVDFYAHLLSDPVALQEWRQDVAAHRGRERNLDETRELQVDLIRQNVTFLECKFEANTYGERSDATNYGTLGIETNDNDCVVDRCIFRDNDFGDVNVVVCGPDSDTQVWFFCAQPLTHHPSLLFCCFWFALVTGRKLRNYGG